MLTREPTPEEAAELADECRRLLDSLQEPELRQIALWKVEGYTHEEIAARLDCVPRTIERKVSRIRLLWKHELEDRRAMNPERPSAYEQLSLEAAARVDAVCDGFEKAWKAARSGAAAPQRLDVSRRLRRGRANAYSPVSCSRSTEPAGSATASMLGSNTPRNSERRPRPAASSATRSLAATAMSPRAGRLTGRTFPDWSWWTSWVPGGWGWSSRPGRWRSDRDVAVKFLRDAHRAEPGRRERFVQEARAIARLRHPHLVQLYEFGEVPAAGGAASQPYLVLEYVSGGSLADVLRGSPQPPGEAARLVATLADAIHYAHQQGVIHRDLKPANVLLHSAGSQRGGAVRRGARPAVFSAACSDRRPLRQGHRLRPGQVPGRRRPDAQWRRGRHAQLHGPGAGGGQVRTDHRGGGCLWPGGHPLRSPDRPPAVRGGDG